MSSNEALNAQDLRQIGHQLRDSWKHRHDGGAAGQGASTAGATSDLTIDETLLLHSIGWEPVDLVIGASVTVIPPSTFVRGWNATGAADGAYTLAVANATERLHAECRDRQAHGVIGVEVEFRVARHHVTAIMVGTAVRPSSHDHADKRSVFVSDLSTRDFCLLHTAGWTPLGLAFGTAFIQVPRRSAGTALRQSTANVELTLLTDALYQAREAAMERMQTSALAVRATGVVAVRVEEGPLSFASHVIGFTAWGTAIRLSGESHNYLQPRMVVPIDDREQLFKVAALGLADLTVEK